VGVRVEGAGKVLGLVQDAMLFVKLQSHA
jgi:hypothetical protein